MILREGSHQHVGDDVVDRFAGYEPSSALRGDALDRVLAARARGERRILPVFPTRTAGLRKRGWILSLAAASIVTVLLVFMRATAPSPLTAGDLSGTLSLSPAHPSPGARVVVRYDAPAIFGRERTLRLRARFRTEWDPTYNRGLRQSVVATLERGRDGIFAGAFDLPADAVYGAFAIENAGATRVDSRNGRLWDLIVYRDGRPTASALTQQFNDVIERSPDSALAIARVATELHPDDAGAWASRFAFESYMLGGPRDDGALEIHFARLHALDSALRQRNDVRPEEMLGLRDYAIQLGSPEHPLKDISTYWSDRLRAAGGPHAAAFRIGTLNSAALRDSSVASAALDTVEQLWSQGDSLSTRSAEFGFQIARAARDSAAVVRWLDRLAPRESDGLWYRYEPLAARDVRYVDVSLVRLRTIAATYQSADDQHRPLEMTAADDAHRRADFARQTLLSIGALLLRRGDTAAALDTLRRTIDDGWDLVRFERVAAIYLRTRDTANAAKTYAFVAADPATPATRVDSLSSIFVRALGEPKWNALVRDASHEMTRRVLEGSTSRSLPPNVVVSDEGGRRVLLDTLVHGRIVVITFWSRFCGPSRMQLPLLETTRKALEARGVALVPITVEAPSAEVASFLHESHVALASLYDDRGQARVATNNNGTPTYYIVDASGRIRFEGHSATLALTQAVALKGLR
jgi:hypothetical protein